MTIERHRPVLTSDRSATGRRSRRKVFSEVLESRLLFASASTILQYDFNSGNPWSNLGSSGSVGVTSSVGYGAVGTIDTAGGTTGTGAVTLSVSGAPSGPYWSSTLTSGLLAVSNTETNLGKLTLAFDLSASVARQLTVSISSFNAGGQLTGTLEAPIRPAAADTYQRFAVDLSSAIASTGSFNPAAPFVSIGFTVDSLSGWQPSPATQIRVDNVNYTRPAYYVSVTGNNNASGRSEATAFASVQRALDLSQPGDVILVMGGTYPNARSGNSVRSGGTPAAWVSIRNYPGQTPVFQNDSNWNVFNIGNGSRQSPSTGPAVAYVEIRGLRIRGNAETANTTYPSLIGVSDPRTNNNGISVEGRYEANIPHHIRIADNIVEYVSGGGISILEADRIAIENNITRYNANWSIYANSGISILAAVSYDGSTGYTRLVTGNQSYGNQGFVPWIETGALSDGNGIILDYNYSSPYRPNGVTLGRTLVQNNLAYNNGGSGIHAYYSRNIDIVNNTAYLNSASPGLAYGQIFAGTFTSNINIYNNILVAPVANTPAAETPEPVTSNSVGPTLVYRNNIYSGGNITPRVEAGDRIIAPALANPGISGTVDFRLQPASPAINSGSTALTTGYDLLGNVRTGSSDLGAYEYYGTAPTVLSVVASALTGSTATLAALAADADGPTGLTYTWSVASRPAGVPDPVFAPPTDNRLNRTGVTFNGVGDYLLRVTVTDAAGNSGFGTVLVTVPPIITGLTVSPINAPVGPNSSRQFTATGTDQYGRPLRGSDVVWSVIGFDTTISSSGLLTTGPGSLGTFVVRATVGNVSATASSAVADTQSPTIVSAASVKTHGLAGSFSVPLAVTGSPTVEPRINGVSRLVLTFSESVVPADGVLNAEDFSITNATFESASINGNVLTLDLTGAVDRSIASIGFPGLTDLFGNPFAAASVIRFNNVYGDVNGDGSVSSADEVLVRTNQFRALTATNSRFDLDTSGYITIADLRAIRDRLIFALV